MTSLPTQRVPPHPHVLRHAQSRGKWHPRQTWCQPLAMVSHLSTVPPLPGHHRLSSCLLTTQAPLSCTVRKCSPSSIEETEMKIVCAACLSVQALLSCTVRMCSPSSVEETEMKTVCAACLSFKAPLSCTVRLCSPSSIEETGMKIVCAACLSAQALLSSMLF